LKPPSIVFDSAGFFRLEITFLQAAAFGDGDELDWWPMDLF